MLLFKPISLAVTSLALGQSYDYPSANDVTLKDIGKMEPNLTTTKHDKARTEHIFPVTVYKLRNHDNFGPSADTLLNAK